MNRLLNNEVKYILKEKKIKKFIGLFVFLILSLNLTTANAKTPDRFDYLILSLMNKEIGNAVANYYKDDSARVQYHWTKDYDVVELDQTEKGHTLKALFEVKIHIKVENNNNVLGVDTLTFGITPKPIGEESKIELLNYKHKD